MGPLLLQESPNSHFKPRATPEIFLYLIHPIPVVSLYKAQEISGVSCTLYSNYCTDTYIIPDEHRYCCTISGMYTNVFAFGNENESDTIETTGIGSSGFSAIAKQKEIRLIVIARCRKFYVYGN